MITCCICGAYKCKEGVTFHKLPKNVEKRALWLKAIRKKIHNFSDSENLVICNQHFETDCIVVNAYGRAYLKSDSVPTIFELPLIQKYNIDLVDQQIESQNICDDTANVTMKLPVAHQEEYEESPCSGSIPEGSTQNITVSKAQASVLKRPRMTKFGTTQNASIKIILEENKEKTEVQRAREEADKFRKQLKVCQQRCRRLQDKVDSLTALLRYVREKQKELLSEDDLKLIDD